MGKSHTLQLHAFSQNLTLHLDGGFNNYNSYGGGGGGGFMPGEMNSPSGGKVRTVFSVHLSIMG